MPTYSIQLPDGRVMDAEAPDEPTALKGAQDWFAANGKSTPAAQPVTAGGGGAGGAVAGATEAANPDSPGPWAQFKDYFTGASRTEFPDAPEFVPAYIEATKKPAPALMGSAVTPDPKAQLDILKKNIPGLETKQDSHGNLMLKAPGMQDWAYLNKPGASGRDLDEFMTQTLATLPFARGFGVGGSIPARMATGAASMGGASVAQDVAAMAQGSEQGVDPERAAVSAGLGAATGPVLGNAAAPAAAAATPRQQAIEAADRLGIKIPQAAASDNFAVSATGAAVKELPLVGAPLVNASKKAVSDIEGKAASISSSLGAGSDLAAGHAIKDDLMHWMRVGSEDEASALYDPVRKALGLKKGLLDNTANTISTLVGRSVEAGLDPPAIVDTINKAVNRAQLSGGMSFDGMQTLRKEIGKRLSGAIVPEPGLDKEALKSLYAGLTEDMGKLAGRQGSRARVAWENANNVFKQDIARRRDALEKIVGDTGNASAESVVATIRKMAGTGSGADFARLLQAKRTIGPQAWDELGSAIVADMGKTADGFSLAHFRSAYEKIADPAKHALFSPAHKRALDDIATVSRKFVALQRLGNPSGSARIGLIATTIPSSIVSAIMAPHLLVTGAAGLGVSHVLARILARPATAKSAARWMNAYVASANASTRSAAAVLDQASRQLLDAMTREGIKIPSPQQGGSDGNRANTLQ